MPSAPGHHQERPKRDVRHVSASEAGYDWRWSKPGGTADQARERDGWQCVRCVQLYGEGGAMSAFVERGSRVKANKDGQSRALTVDHIVPAHIIGTARFHDLDNLQTLCEEHHTEKTNTDKAKYGSARR